MLLVISVAADEMAVLRVVSVRRMRGVEKCILGGLGWFGKVCWDRGRRKGVWDLPGERGNLNELRLSLEPELGFLTYFRGMVKFGRLVDIVELGGI